MDMGDMHKKTSIYQSMAGAVEDAAVVIVCMSESYFNSENCEKGKNIYLLLYTLG